MVGGGVCKIITIPGQGSSNINLGVPPPSKEGEGPSILVKLVIFVVSCAKLTSTSRIMKFSDSTFEP